MSVASVTTVSNVVGWPGQRRCSVSAPSIGESAPGVAVIRKKFSQPGVVEAGAALGAHRQIGLPSKQKYALASESFRW